MNRKKQIVSSVLLLIVIAVGVIGCTTNVTKDRAPTEKTTTTSTTTTK